MFGRIAGLPSDGVPYPLFALAGLLPWQLFSTALSGSANSVVSSAGLLTKVYFPRLILPLSTIIVALADLGISFGILLLMMLFYRFAPDWRIVFLPAFVALGVLAAVGPALLMSAMNVKYRDFRYVIPFVVQLGLYVSPVGFTSAIVSPRWRLAYSINPMVGVIDGFRWCLLHGQAKLYIPGFLVSLGITAAFLWIGIRYFRESEKTFADVV